MKTIVSKVLIGIFFLTFLRHTGNCMPPRPDLFRETDGDELLEKVLESDLLCALSRERTSLSYPAKVKCVILLVDFTDVRADTLSHSPGFYKRMLFDQSNPMSMRSYYLWNSYGKLEIEGEVIGWFRLPQPLLFYSDNRRGMGSYPRNARKMIEDAIAVADPYVDFSKFDNDGPDGIPSSGDDDGIVDFFMVVHAGSGYEWTLNNRDIHSHAGLVSVEVDGVRITSYATEPEDGKVGTFAHEFGHLLGLPDLYDVTYKSYGLGIWSLMAFGSWGGGDASRPVGLDAWSKAKLGFLDPVVIATNIANYSLPAVCNSPVVLRLWNGGSIGTEYFLVENRMARGWDSYLGGFGEGLLIYHVNERFPDNSGDAGHLIELIQADGRNDLAKKVNFGFGSDGGDPYPGTTGNRDFSWWTTPSNHSFTGIPTQVSLRNISDPGDQMTFDLEVISPVVVLKDYATDDSAGDADGRPEPGERISLVLRLVNYGVACRNVRFNLNTQDPGFEIIEGSSFLSFIGANTVSEPISFIIDISRDVSEPYQAPLILLIEADHETGTYSYQESFSLSIPLHLAEGWPQRVAGIIVASPLLADIDGDDFEEIVVGCIRQMGVGLLKGSVYAWNLDGDLVHGFPVELDGPVQFKPAACDLDVDGAQELVVATVSGLVYVLRGDGTSYPGWPRGLDSKIRVSPVVSDVDDDGLVEIICCTTRGEIFVWDENGRLEKGWPVDLGNEILITPGIGDIDGDYVADIVVGEYGGRLHCINGFGKSLKGWPVDIGKGCGDGGATIADFDGDGKFDIAISSLFSNTVYLVGNDGNVKPGWPRVTTNCSQLSSPVAADIDRDGIPEVAVTTSCGTLVAWDGKGKECRTIVASVPNKIQSCQPIFVDLDGNGTIEVVFGTSAGPASKVYAFSDAGNVSGFPIAVSGDVIASPVIADIDRDGHFEIIVATNTGDVYIWSYSGAKPAGRAEYSQERGDVWNTGQYKFKPKENVAMPDLAVYGEEIAIEPEKPRQGEQARITATIRNIGHARSQDVVVRFYYDSVFDGCKIGEVRIDSIEPKARTNISQVWSVPFGEPTRQIIVVVDPEDRVLENSDLNNACRRRVYLSLADLEVAFERVEPFPVIIGDSMSVWFSLRNKGEDIAPGFKVIVLDSLSSPSGEGLTLKIDSLAAGESMQFIYRTIALPFTDDFRRVWVISDPDSNVVEYYRSNNRVEIRIPSGVYGEIFQTGLNLPLTDIKLSRYFAVSESPSCNCIFATPLKEPGVLFEHSGNDFDVCRNTVVLASQGDILGYDLSREEFFVVSDDSAFESEPCVWANRFVWVAQTGDEFRLMLKESDEEAFAIREIDDGAIESPDISSDFIVWREARDGRCKIMAFDLATRRTIEVGEGTCSGSGAKVWGKTVVWSARGSDDLDIEACDLSHERRYWICSHQGNQMEPAIFGELVVWQDERNGNWDIYGYSLSEGFEFPVTRQVANQTKPSLCESTIVWLDHRTGQRLARGIRVGGNRVVANLHRFETLSQDGRIVVRSDIEQLDDSVTYRLYRYKENLPLPAERGRFLRHQFRIAKSGTFGFADTLVVPMRSYYYTLGIVDAYGEERLYGPIEGRCYAKSSAELVVGFSRPNPFRVTTSITLGLPRSNIPSDQVSWPDPSPDAMGVEVGVYSVTGRLIRRVAAGRFMPGYHTFIWDGKDDYGVSVSPGVYFFAITVRAATVSGTVSRKVIYLK